jgi:hypothetical protein
MCYWLRRGGELTRQCDAIKRCMCDKQVPRRDGQKLRSACDGDEDSEAGLCDTCCQLLCSRLGRHWTEARGQRP